MTEDLLDANVDLKVEGGLRGRKGLYELGMYSDKIFSSSDKTSPIVRVLASLIRTTLIASEVTYWRINAL